MSNAVKNPRIDVFNADIVKGAYFSSKYEFPILDRTDYIPLNAIPFNFAKRSIKYDHWIHFYIYDYVFECVWNAPIRYLSLFKKFAGVITPDFSLYRNMPLAMQIWNTYRNRALAHWLQSNGVKTITNVRFGVERTYDFVFEGLQQGGTYAVGTNGCIQKNDDRYHFKKGLAKMVEILKPDTIVNYYYYSKDIFAKYERQGINVVTLKHWT